MADFTQAQMNELYTKYRARVVDTLDALMPRWSAMGPLERFDLNIVSLLSLRLAGVVDNEGMCYLRDRIFFNELTTDEQIVYNELCETMNRLAAELQPLSQKEDP